MTECVAPFDEIVVVQCEMINAVKRDNRCVQNIDVAVRSKFFTNTIFSRFFFYIKSGTLFWITVFEEY